ncbi:hypothetical protein H5410_050153 [Solanum commersonii]|uniref:Uncharacterized protein n=1 Tax=Solanum commersonii TaxID=4109 RepID=A0A9J5WX55_SOLCO|nr:hypothetical protein H5410_050153 [Solanum commersonii]
MYCCRSVKNTNITPPVKRKIIVKTDKKIKKKPRSKIGVSSKVGVSREELEILHEVDVEEEGQEKIENDEDRQDKNEADEEGQEKID